jgi:hypothetical protein
MNWQYDGWGRWTAHGSGLFFTILVTREGAFQLTLESKGVERSWVTLDNFRDACRLCDDMAKRNAVSHA